MRAMAMPSLEDVANEAAAGDEIKRYLSSRSIRTTATLALLATDLEQLDRVLIKPLLDGWKVETGNTIELSTSEKPIAAAILQHMWSTSKMAWSKMQAASTPVPAAAPASTTVSGGGSTSSTTEEKAPKQLPHGVWNKLLYNYEHQQVGGRNRVFPVQEVMGAEQVLARLHWEHETSKLYTPIQLGELLQLRTFLPSGEINPLSKKERTGSTLVISDNKLFQQDEVTWQPRSVLAILDGLSSIKWAFILIGLGDEVDIVAFFDWLFRLARSRPPKMDQMAQFWTATSWRLAMKLRTGKPFKECIGPIMRDYDSFVECMNRDPVYVKKDIKKTTSPPADVGGKAVGKKGQRRQHSGPYDRATRSNTTLDNSWRSSSWNSQYHKKESWSAEPAKGEWKAGWRG